MTRTLGFAVALALAAPLAAQTATSASGSNAVPDPRPATGPRGFDVRDLVTLDRVGDPRISPDGGTVVFQVREVDLQANKGVNGLWLRALAGDAAPRRLTTQGVSSSAPRWSPDGRSVYFLSSRSGASQVWRVELAGGEARQVTDYPLDVGSFVLAPNGRQLAVALEVFPDCADFACTKARLDAQRAKKAAGQVYDELFVRHWDVWASGMRSQLYVADLDAGGKAEANPAWVSKGIDGDVPSKPFGDDGEYAFSPDGKHLVFSARIAGKTEPWSTNFDLYEVPLAGGSPKNLTAANPAWDTGPVFAKDGKTLYYRAMKRAGFEADRFGVMALDRASGKVREINPGWDRSADNLAVSGDGKTLYTVAADLGTHKLFAIEAKSGEASVVHGHGTVSAFDLAADGGIVFARDDLKAPAQLFAVKAGGGTPRQLTRFNADKLADVRFGDYEQFEFAGAGGDTVHGYVVKPWNYRAGAKYPVAFIIHGGPQGSMGDNFHYRWNPQTYAGRGYAAVFVDFHGSTGYGQAFTDAIRGHWGSTPLDDLKAGLAHALASYDFLDGSRVCALGASYGGFMVNFIAGHWREPFDCLVSHDGVFDQRMMGYATEELWFTEWENEGLVYAKPESYDAFNPALHAKDWKVPMLVIHGQLDYRIPVEQGIAAFTALRRQGVPGQFLYFPDENHWVLKPANSIQWHDTVNAWLDRWAR